MKTMNQYPFAVISGSLGKRSETFIYRHMADLLPQRTLAIVRSKEPDLNELDIAFPYCTFGSQRKDWRWFYRGTRYALGISQLSPVQVTVGQMLASHGIQVVLSEYLNLSLKWLHIAQQQGIRFFAHAHGYDVSSILRDPEMRRKYLRLDAADGIITMSQVSRQRLMALGLNGAKIHVIPYGIDVPDEAPILRDQRDTIRCLAVGRMVAKKAPLLTLESFRQALADCPALQLDYIGTGELFDAARQFVADHDLGQRVTLHGGQPNTMVQDLMRQADVFLQHSRTDPETGDEEGLPVAILEAMAHGLPVVSTRHAGIPESVLEGKTGYLVDEGEVAGMAHGLVQLANDAGLRYRFGHAGWQRAQQHFTWERERAALLELLGLTDTH